MKTSNMILPQCRPSKEKRPIGSIYAMRSYLLCSNRHLGRALRTFGAIVGIAFVGLLSSAAWGANPAEEMAKAGAGGGTGPKGESWGASGRSGGPRRHAWVRSRIHLGA